MATPFLHAWKLLTHCLAKAGISLQEKCHLIESARLGLEMMNEVGKFTNWGRKKRSEKMNSLVKK